MLEGKVVGFCPSGGVASAKYPAWSTMTELKIAGFVVEEVTGIHVLTETGNALATEHKAKLASARAKRNAASRGRSQAMRDVGMVKTPYGWE